jgi:hypothetical protein
VRRTRRRRKSRAARSTGRPRGRPKSEDLAPWKLAGASSKATHYRHLKKAAAADASETENASRHLSKNISRDAISVSPVPDSPFLSAERIKRDGALHRLDVLEGEIIGPGGCAMAPPPPINHLSRAIARAYVLEQMGETLR